MPLILLTGPELGDTVGEILSVTNVQKSGSQGLVWAYEQQGGIMTNTRRYTNTLRVVTSSALVGPIQIQQFLIGIGAVQGVTYRFPLPEYNRVVNANTPALPPNPTEIDTGSFLSTLTFAQETEDGCQWLCTFNYGPFNVGHEVGTTDAASGASNPIESVPEVDWSHEIHETAYVQDVNGLPFRNTVGDPLENPPKREESRQTLSFTRNEATYNETYAQQYVLKTNSDTFLGFAPNQARIKSITGKRTYSTDYGFYWRVSYVFEFRVLAFIFPATFDPIDELAGGSDSITITYGFEELVLNEGFRQVGADGKIAPILVGGQPISAPMALDEGGSPINNDVDLNGQLEEPFYLIFNNYSQIPFADLNIPTDVLTTNQ